MTEHVWFTADTHFAHQRILKFHPDRNPDPDQYAWNDPEALAGMEEMLITAWNACVQRHDHIYLVGDFCFGYQEDAERVFRQLNGHKHLIVGNHDPVRVQKLGWESVADIKEVKAGGHKFVLCHFPMVSWNKMHKGVYHLHGHSHGGLIKSGEARRQPARMDVGIDCHPNLRPFHIDEVMATLNTADLSADANHGPNGRGDN